MSKIILPIFVIEGEDVIIFNSLEDVQSQLEPIDVRNNIFISYDAEGKLVKIETDGRYINVKLVEEEPMHVAELEALLRNYLIAMKEPEAEEATCDLQCLVQLSLKYACKTTFREYIRSLRDKLLGK